MIWNVVRINQTSGNNVPFVSIGRGQMDFNAVACDLVKDNGKYRYAQLLTGKDNGKTIVAVKFLTDFVKGYSFNARMNQLEDKVDRRLAQHDQAIVDLKEKVDFFVQTKEPPLQGIFYQGRYWDAKSLLIMFIRRFYRHCGENQKDISSG